MSINPSKLICPAIFQNIILGKTGQPLINGKIFFYQDANHSLLKNVYEQTGNLNNPAYVAVPNPMTLSAAGTTVDVNGNDILLFFYPWSETDENIKQPYFVEVYDQYGTLQFTRFDFPFLPEESGPGPVPGQIYSNQNLIVNNKFWRHVDNLSLSSATVYPSWTYQYGSSSPIYYQTLCPDQHDGYSMPDFNYVKSSTVAVETISFNSFSSGDLVLSGDIQPEYYITHTCTGDTGTYQKIYQFPIALHLANLSNQTATFTIQARGSIILSFYIYSFAGSSTSAGTSTQTLIGTMQLTSNWTKEEISFTFPTNLGIPQNFTFDDAYYLQIGFSSGSVSFDFTLPSIYLSPENTTPTNYFASYDQIDSIALTPRTGDIRTSANGFVPYGWLAMNNGIIGLANPGGNSFYSRAASDVWPLFNLLWNIGKSYDSGSAFNPLFQMVTNTAGSLANTDYGTSAILDFIASGPAKALALPQSMGQVFMGTVPLSSVLQSTGYSQVVTASQLSSAVTATSDLEGILFTGSTVGMAFGEIVQFSASGSLPANISALTNYYAIPAGGTNFYVATSLVNAQQGTYVTFSNTGTGVTVQTFSLVFTGSDILILYIGAPIVFTNTGGTLPTGIVANAVYYAVPSSQNNFCVGTTFQNAINGTLINYTDAGSGTTKYTQSPLGATIGEAGHTQLVPQIGKHVHAIPTFTSVGATNSVISTTTSSAITLTPTYPEGTNNPNNIIQNSTFMNIFIKL